MRKRRLLRRGWFGTSVSYIYLTILAVIAGISAGLGPGPPL